MELAVVVAVPGHARGVDDRPIRHVPEEPVSVILQIVRFEERGGKPQGVGVRGRPVPLLDRVAAAK